MSINEVIVAKVSDYAWEYLYEWMEQNDIDAEGALDEILRSLRRDTENDET